MLWMQEAQDWALNTFGCGLKTNTLPSYLIKDIRFPREHWTLFIFTKGVSRQNKFGSLWSKQHNEDYVNGARFRVNSRSRANRLIRVQSPPPLTSVSPCVALGAPKHSFSERTAQTILSPHVWALTSLPVSWGPWVPCQKSPPQSKKFGPEQEYNE